MFNLITITETTINHQPGRIISWAGCAYFEDNKPEIGHEVSLRKGEY